MKARPAKPPAKLVRPGVLAAMNALYAQSVPQTFRWLKLNAVDRSTELPDVNPKFSNT